MKPFPTTRTIKERLRVAAAKACGWKGTAYRAVGAEYANSRDLLSGEGTRRFGGRWTPLGSFATVHARLDLKTAISESLGMQERYGLAIDARLPITLVAIEVRLHEMLNLTDRKVLAELKLSRSKLVGSRWRESMEKAMSR